MELQNWSFQKNSKKRSGDPIQRAADNPVPVSVEKSTNFDIYYPPKNIKFSPTFAENGIMTAKCEVDNSYPEPTFDIPWILENSVTSEETKSENDKIYKTFQYPISPSNANDVSFGTGVFYRNA